MHNGKIEVKSKLGEGTEFIITLPILQTLLEGSTCDENSEVNSLVEKMHIEFSDIYSNV